jgi:hypothetical protein
LLPLFPLRQIITTQEPLESHGGAIALRSHCFSSDFQNDIVPERNGAWECLVAEFSRKSGMRINCRDTWRAARIPLRWVWLLVLFLSTGNNIAKAAAIQNGAAASAGPGLTVAIADFDGDHRLDLASIQTGRDGCGGCAYWIQFQLSSAGRQSVQLVAPPGGLRIEARDVNGDHAVDLVFTTAWFRQPVAILLNDGHGSFSRAEPTAFPGAFSEPKTNWVAGTHLAATAVGLPPQSRARVDEAEKAPLHQRFPTRLILPLSPIVPAGAFLFFAAGRAPPAAVSLR